MAKQGAKTVAPRLRFPEFREAKPWGTEKLSTLASRVTVKNVDGQITRVLTNSAEFGVLDQRDYFDKDIATAGKTDGYYVVEKGDYVYNPRTSALAPVGPISRNDLGNGVMSPLYTVFRFSAKQSDFYRHYFYSTGWHAYLRSAASTGARHDRMSITNDAFMRMPLPVPEPDEQQKIADCLTSLDEVIAAQGRKMEALKAHKRGLMQQLFPRIGETRPRLRFPEFRNAPEWTIGTLGGVCEVLNNRRVPISSGDRRPGSFPYYGASGVVDFVDSFIFDERLLLVGEDGAKWGAFEETAFIADGKYWVNNHAHVLKPVQVIDTLLANYLTMIDLASYVTGHAPPKLTLAKLKSIAVVYPPSRSEQQRIADCLTSLDIRITAETARLAALRTHKQGLMQQLFPAPEATGA